MASSMSSPMSQAFDRTVSQNASRAEMIGLSETAPQKKKRKSATIARSSLTRSHGASGLRVGSSSSRGRLLYSAGGTGPVSWSGHASPGLPFPLPVSASLIGSPCLVPRPLHRPATWELRSSLRCGARSLALLDRPRRDDFVDGLGILHVAPRLAPDHECVEQARRGIGQRRLVHRIG